MGLLAVPRASFRGSQTGHDANKLIEVLHSMFRTNRNCIKSRVISLAANDGPCSGLVAELAYVPFPRLIWDGTSRLIGFVGGLVAELAYAYGSGPYSERIAGSSPAQSTNELSRGRGADGSE